ncbi:MAG: glycoside hydrolase family 172 protein [Spirochaetota bacterium]
MTNFNGLGMHLGNLSLLSSARTRSISPENVTGEPGKGGMASEGTGQNAARDLGTGWKISPFIVVKPGETAVLADIRGSGAIQHIWMTLTGKWRFSLLKIYWEGSREAAVECPVGDFFACGWGEYAQISSLAVCLNPKSGFNCYWEMPFRRACRITLTNIDSAPVDIYYQIDYTLTEVPENAAYFHAQFRRVNPLPYKQVYTILDGVEGQGQYAGTYLAWGVNNTGWWGEGEIKFYLDDDKEFPTICGTGTEDYFCGSYGFSAGGENSGFKEFATPYSGLAQVLRPDGFYRSQTRFGLYRWHITDPVRFRKTLKVTIQALGWRSQGRYLPLQDDIASVAFWYQTLPAAPFPELPGKDYLEII